MKKKTSISFLARAAVTLLLCVLTTATAWAKIESCIYECEGLPGYIHVRGYWFDREDLFYAYPVAVVVFTDKWSQYGEIQMTLTNKLIIDGYYVTNSTGNWFLDHGFDFYIPAGAGTYYVQVIGYDLNNNYSLMNSPYTAVTVTAAQGITIPLTVSTWVTLQDGDTLTGTGGVNTRIKIADGATVTLSDVNITAIPNDKDHQWAGITCLGDATIILADGTNNAVMGGNYCYPGICPGPPGKTLTIRGGGSLSVSGNDKGGGSHFSAGIGSGFLDPQGCGDIVIEGGNISAYGGSGPAIGAAPLSDCGAIIIKGGNVYAESSGEAPAIGCQESICDGVSIRGGFVSAKSKDGPAIGSHNKNAKCKAILITGGTVLAETATATYSIGPYGDKATCDLIVIGDKVEESVTMSPFCFYDGMWREDYPLTSETGDVLLRGAIGLTGTGGADTHVTVADGAIVTLNGATILSDHWAGITCLGDATIILADGTTNTIRGWSAISFPEGKTLTIRGNGSLTAIANVSSFSSAAIGAGYGRNCGDIVIEGGTITANGGYQCAGIGGAENGACGNITITDGVASVTATAGESAPYSIGAGYGSSCGTVTIAGIETGSIDMNPYTFDPSLYNTITFNANGGEGTMSPQTHLNLPYYSLNACTFTRDDFVFVGWNTRADGSGTPYADGQTVMNTGSMTLYAQWHANYDVSFDANGGTGEMAPQHFVWNTEQALTANTFTREGSSFGGWNTEADGSGTAYNDGQVVNNLGNITLYAQWGKYTLMSDTRELLLSGEVSLTGTGGADTHVTIADGATVTLNGVTITDITDYYVHRWAGITCLGDATIILADGTTNTIKSGLYTYPAIYIPEGKTLTIRGSGSLIAFTDDGAAAIGAGEVLNCGDIVIEGGTITANGGSNSAGIGGAKYGSCGNITITDGVASVTATAGLYNHYSIGPGKNSCGTVTIGGVVTGGIAVNSYTYAPSETTVCTVTFNANGGQGEMDALTLWSNIPQALTANTFTREDYGFVGWNTRADGSGTPYADGQTVMNTGSVTLYAQWVTTLDMELADNADNAGVIGAKNGLTCRTLTLTGRTIYSDGDWNTLCLPFNVDGLSGTPLEGFTVMELDTETTYNGHKTGMDGGTLYLNFRDAESIVAGRPYIVKRAPSLLISTDAEWEAFAAAVGSGTTYEGQWVQLGADISVTAMVGGTFKGTFDGAGHTIHATLSGSSDGMALFSEINGATIQNLTVTGSIATSYRRPATFAATVKGSSTIKNCWSAADISSSGGSTWVDGGAFVSLVNTGATIVMQDCAFTGSIAYTNSSAKEGGGMVGWAYDNVTAYLTRCLFAPSALTMSNAQEMTYIFVSGIVRGTLTNCYYNNVAAASVLQNEGTDATGWSNAQLLAALGSNWQESGGQVVPKVEYANIENPTFVGVTVTATEPTAVTSDDGKVSFVGSYDPTDIAGEDRSILFLGAANTLYYPNDAMTINSCRAYFELNGITAGDPSAGVRAFKLNFGEGKEEETSLLSEELRVKSEESDDAWYDMSGRKIANGQRPTAKGIYIHNGRKEAVK